MTCLMSVLVTGLMITDLYRTPSETSTFARMKFAEDVEKGSCKAVKNLCPPKKTFKFLVLYRLEKNFSLKLGQIIYYIYLGNIYS